MCRMIVAHGHFQVRSIVAAAVAMATGQTADHDGAFCEHPNGWGALWRDPASPTGICVLRDPRPAADTALASPLCEVRTDFLAVHVRRAMPAHNVGLRFTHPLQRAADDWHFMHNGSQPTVHKALGLAHSVFDSAEYFDYLIPAGADELDRETTMQRLRSIPEPGANSGNAIAVRQGRAYLVHWRSPGDNWPRYFTMQEFVGEGLRVIASEVVPALAPARAWRPVPPQTLLEFQL